MFVFFVLLSKIISWREMKEPAEVQQDRTAIFFHPWQHCYFVVSGIASQRITNSQSDNRLQNKA